MTVASRPVAIGNHFHRFVEPSQYSFNYLIPATEIMVWYHKKDDSFRAFPSYQAAHKAGQAIELWPQKKNCLFVLAIAFGKISRTQLYCSKIAWFFDEHLFGRLETERKLSFFMSARENWFDLIRSILLQSKYSVKGGA